MGPAISLRGRLRTVLLDRERRLWGRLDRERDDVELLGESRDDPAPDAVDVLDELARLTITHGGRALSVPSSEMPTDSGAAAVLR